MSLPREMIAETAIDILSKTDDGDQLTPEDLKLVEHGINGNLNEEGELALLELRDRALAGYKKPWLHGIEHLTKNLESYVYWRDTEIEHYSFRDAQQEREAAQNLAAICRAIENDGLTVTPRAVLEYMIDRRKRLVREQAAS